MEMLFALAGIALYFVLVWACGGFDLPRVRLRPRPPAPEYLQSRDMRAARLERVRLETAAMNDWERACQCPARPRPITRGDVERCALFAPVDPMAYQDCLKSKTA